MNFPFFLYAVVGVFFTTPEVSVNEDVPSMATEVCFTANATTATPYVVRLGRRETGDNPATGELWSVASDYVAL